MAKLCIIFVFSFVAVCSAILRHPDAHNRAVRSPHYGNFGPLPPPPPPPPIPIFRTQNWSGISKGPDGLPQGVFSGAAATAGAPGAVSLASSSANSGTDCDEGASGEQSGAYKSSQSGFGAGNSGSQFGGASASSSFGGGYSSKSIKESHFSIQGGQEHGSGFKGQGGFGAGVYKDNENSNIASNTQRSQQQLGGGGFGQTSSGSYGHGGQGVEFAGGNLQVSNAEGRGTQGAAESQSASFSQDNNGGTNTGQPGFGAGYGNHRGFGSSNQASSNAQEGGFGSFGQSDQFGGSQRGQFGFNHHHESGRGFNGGSETSQSSRYESGVGGEQFQNSGSELGNTSGSGYSQKEDISSTLGGALNLASQGLKSSQDAGCSTCAGKSGYALSNAKSNSGSAVAVSIGG